MLRLALLGQRPQSDFGSISCSSAPLSGEEDWFGLGRPNQKRLCIPDTPFGCWCIDHSLDVLHRTVFHRIRWVSTPETDIGCVSVSQSVGCLAAYFDFSLLAVQASCAWPSRINHDSYVQILRRSLDFKGKLAELAPVNRTCRECGGSSRFSIMVLRITIELSSTNCLWIIECFSNQRYVMIRSPT